MIVINNNKLRQVYGNLGFKAGFAKADEVLATAARGIAEVITHHYRQNIDLKDAKTVLSNSGTAIMGSAVSEGSNRAEESVVKALDSPLLKKDVVTPSLSTVSSLYGPLPRSLAKRSFDSLRFLTAIPICSTLINHFF